MTSIKKKILVLSIEFPLQAYLRDFINVLYDKGVNVDFIFTEKQDEFIDFTTFKSSLYNIQINPNLKFVLRILEKVFRTYVYSVSTSKLIVYKRKICNLIKNKDYDYVICVEKKSLILAYDLFEPNKIIYYSLELYYQDHPNYKNFQTIIDLEKKVLSKIDKLIIQDNFRKNAFEHSVGKVFKHTFLLPVGTIVPKQKSIVKKEKFVILYFGILNKYREESIFVNLLQQLNEDEIVVLRVPKSKIENKGRKLKLIENHLSESEIFGLVQECDIGIAFYSNSFSNNRLIAYSSHKIAMYLACGKPIIVIKNETFVDLFGKFHCGEMITDKSELRGKIDKIRENYAIYSSNAVSAFESLYDIEKSQSFINFIDFVKK